MKKTFFTLATLAFAVLMSGCSNDQVTDRNDGLNAAKFRVTTSRTTRANAGEINSMLGKILTVFVHDDGTNVVTDANGNKVEKFYLNVVGGSSADSDTVIYETFADAETNNSADAYPIYLPQDGTVQFVSFADTGDNDLDGVVSYTFTSGEINMTYNNDPLSETVYAISPEVGVNDAQNITLNFEHIVSQLLFSVAGITGEIQSAITSFGIEINSVTVAKVPVSGVWNSTSGFSGYGQGSYTQSEMAGVPANSSNNVAENSNSYTVAATTTGAQGDNEEFASLFILPGTLTGFGGDEPTVTVNYSIYATKDASDANAPYKTGEKTIKFSDFSASVSIGAWVEGKRYTYQFRPTAVLGASFAATMTGTAWEDGGLGDIEPNVQP